MATVLFDYVASGPGELTISRGDTVEVTDPGPDGWARGRVGFGAVGWFPFDYVEELHAVQSEADDSDELANIVAMTGPDFTKGELASLSTTGNTPWEVIWRLIQAFLQHGSDDNEGRKILPPPDERLFTTDLARVLDKDRTNVPVFLTHAIDYLRDTCATKAEGIFRLSASASDMQQWRLALDYDHTLPLDPINDHNLVASLLKMFVREIPGALISHEAGDKLIHTLTKPPTSMVATMNGLPAEKRNTLCALMDLLVEIAEIEENRMDANNLALIFGQNIFHQPPGFDPDLMKGQIAVLRRMIENWSSIRGLLIGPSSS